MDYITTSSILAILIKHMMTIMQNDQVYLKKKNRFHNSVKACFMVPLFYILTCKYRSLTHETHDYRCDYVITLMEVEAAVISHKRLYSNTQTEGSKREHRELIEASVTEICTCARSPSYVKSERTLC